jgi:predicted RNA-binding protein Jag
MTQENQVDQIATKFATLTSDQIQQFVENYAERIVDDMDTKTLMQFAYDVIVENLNIQSPDDILNEVSCVYDDDIVEELIESVTV